jgi:integrase
MARPRTQVGTHGAIALTGHVTDDRGRRIKAPAGTKPTVWRARTKYRDKDGRTRDVEAWAPTKGKAETALKVRLSERVLPTTRHDGLHRDMTVIDAAEEWLRTVERQGRLSRNTLNQYREAIDRHIKGSSVAKLSLAEANRVAVLERYLQEVADARGLGSAKTARTVLGSILGLAVRHEALDGNRLRDAQPPHKGKAREGERDTGRAFTRAELADVLAKADRDETAKAYDLADLLHLLAGTGARISEALALRWEHVDLDAGEIHIQGTKTKGSLRVVTVPAWLVDRLRSRRAERGAWGLVFPTPEAHPVQIREDVKGPRWQARAGESIPASRWGGRKTDPHQPRDRRDVTRKLRAILDEAGYPWATAHTFRRTVGDLVSEAAGPTEAANMLGHARPSMTLDHYTDRRQKTAAGAAALEVLGG